MLDLGCYSDAHVLTQNTLAYPECESPKRKPIHAFTMGESVH
jgi:hypothetical protein